MPTMVVTIAWRRTFDDGSGLLESTVKFFYNSAWQCLEERTTPVVGSPSTATYVWGQRYIDDLICRDISAQRIYAMQDRQFKTIGLISTTGTVLERYSYTPYGQSTFYDANFTIRTTSAIRLGLPLHHPPPRPETGSITFGIDTTIHSEICEEDFDWHWLMFIFCTFTDPLSFDGHDLNLYSYMSGYVLTAQAPLALTGDAGPPPGGMGGHQPFGPPNQVPFLLQPW
ncbi:MAG: hypothetical protein R3C05_10470 [Pirellulaceae bacterium]